MTSLTPPLGAYVPVSGSGPFWVSGHTDRTADKPATRGVAGRDVGVADVRRAARGAADNVWRVAQTVAARPVQLRVYVNAGDDADVLDRSLPALLEECRLAMGTDCPVSVVGVASLPGGAVVEIEGLFSSHEATPGMSDDGGEG